MGNQLNLISPSKKNQFIFEIDGMPFNKFFDRFGDAGRTAVIRGVNQGGEKMRIAVTSSLREYTGIKSKDLKKQRRFSKKASGGNLEYAYRWRKKSVPLDTVSYKKAKGGFQTGAKIAPHRTFAPAFKIGGSGKTAGQIYQRGDKRISRVYTGSVSMSQAQVKGLHSWGESIVRREFERQMQLYWDGKNQ